MKWASLMPPRRLDEGPAPHGSGWGNAHLGGYGWRLQFGLSQIKASMGDGCGHGIYRYGERNGDGRGMRQEVWIRFRYGDASGDGGSR